MAELVPGADAVAFAVHLQGGGGVLFHCHQLGKGNRLLFLEKDMEGISLKFACWVLRTSHIASNLGRENQQDMWSIETGLRVTVVDQPTSSRQDTMPRRSVA